MTDWASGGMVKIERAKEHTAALKAEIETFFHRNPYSVVSKVDSEARKIDYYARVSEEPPLRLGAIAGDALHNLRSALDVLWRNVWYPDGGGATDRTIEFPIYETADGLKGRYPLSSFQKKGRKKSAVNLLYEIKPYKGGNDHLWMLHEANVMDKHQLLIPAVGSIAYTTFEFSGLGEAIGLKIPPQRISLREVGVFNVIRDGTPLRSESIDARTPVNVKTEDTLVVAFAEGGAIKGKPMVSTLHEITKAVERIVQTYLDADLIR